MRKVLTFFSNAIIPSPGIIGVYAFSSHEPMTNIRAIYFQSLVLVGTDVAVPLVTVRFGSNNPNEAELKFQELNQNDLILPVTFDAVAGSLAYEAPTPLPFCSNAGKLITLKFGQVAFTNTITGQPIELAEGGAVMMRIVVEWDDAPLNAVNPTYSLPTPTMSIPYPGSASAYQLSNIGPMY